MVFGGIACFSRRDDDEEKVRNLGTGDDVREEPEGMLE
jgi:hypothetical protein